MDLPIEKKLELAEALMEERMLELLEFARMAELHKAYLATFTSMLNEAEMDANQFHKYVQEIVGNWNENTLLVDGDPDYVPNFHWMVLHHHNIIGGKKLDRMIEKNEARLQEILKNGPMPPIFNN